MTELESWKADAFRLMAENLKLEKQRDRLLAQLAILEAEFRGIYSIYYYAEPWAHDTNQVLIDSRKLIAEIEAEK